MLCVLVYAIYICIIQSNRIVKSRQQYFQSKLEVVWEKIDGVDIESPTTLERFEDVECAFPELVEEFMKKKRQKKTTKKGKKTEACQKKITDTFKVRKKPHIGLKSRESLRRSISLEDVRAIKPTIRELSDDDGSEKVKQPETNTKQETTPFPLKYESDDSLPSLSKFIKRKLEKREKSKLIKEDKPKFIMSSSDSESENDSKSETSKSKNKTYKQSSLNFSLDLSF